MPVTKTAKPSEKQAYLEAVGNTKAPEASNNPLEAYKQGVGVYKARVAKRTTEQAKNQATARAANPITNTANVPGGKAAQYAGEEMKFFGVALGTIPESSLTPEQLVRFKAWKTQK